MMLQKVKSQQRRPWIAIAITVAVLCVIIYAGTLEVEEMKQDQFLKETKVHKKSGRHRARRAASAASDEVSVSEASEAVAMTTDDATTTVVSKTDEASLMTRLSECPVNYDVPDPRKTRKYTDEPTITKTGAWELPEKYDYFLDETLAQGLACLFENEWVLELGAGSGHYTQFFLTTEKLRGIRAYDGAPNIEERSAGIVRHADLTRKREFGGPFDWVLCLDVAAHIPESFEEAFLDNIHRHAKKGVIISWTRPGDEGNGVVPVNSREPEYVKSLFKKMGYVQYSKLQQQLRRIAKLKWLRHNIMIFMLKSHECTNC